MAAVKCTAYNQKLDKTQQIQTIESGLEQWQSGYSKFRPVVVIESMQGDCQKLHSRAAFVSISTTMAGFYRSCSHCCRLWRYTSCKSLNSALCKETIWDTGRYIVSMPTTFTSLQKQKSNPMYLLYYVEAATMS